MKRRNILTENPMQRGVSETHEFYEINLLTTQHKC